MEEKSSFLGIRAGQFGSIYALQSKINMTEGPTVVIKMESEDFNTSLLDRMSTVLMS